MSFPRRRRPAPSPRAPRTAGIVAPLPAEALNRRVDDLPPSTRAHRSLMARLAAENLLAGVRGERLPHCVNPEVYENRR